MGALFTGRALSLRKLCVLCASAVTCSFTAEPQRTLS